MGNQEEDALKKKPYKLREKRAPPDKLLPNEDIGKNQKWYQKLRSNQEAYEQYKAKDRLRCKLYRASMSLDKRKRYNEKTRLRMRKMREKKGKETKGIQTEKTVKSESEYLKQEQQSKMTGQGKRRVDEKRSDKYHEMKRLTVKLKFGRKSDCEKVKKVSERVSNPDVFAEGIQKLIENATPREKAALKDRGIVFIPRSKKRSIQNE